MFRADTGRGKGGGGSVGQDPLPPFMETPQLYKEGKNVAGCVSVLKDRNYQTNPVKSH